MVDSSLPPGPFTHLLGLNARERAAVRRRLAQISVRVMPYPFASAMSTVSDCDASTLERYEAYTGCFERLGLDFGDSSWLHFNHKTSTNGAASLGFFSHAFSRGDDLDPNWMEETRTFAQSVAAFHLGRVDHFHSLFRDGPRAVIVECGRLSGAAVEVAVGPLQLGGVWRADDVHLFALLIEGECREACVVEEDGTETAFTEKLEAPEPRHTLLAAPFDPDGENRAMLMRAVRTIRLSGAQDVRRVLLLSGHTQLILERVAYLRHLNIEMGLITEHSKLYFRSPSMIAVEDKARSEKFRSHQGRLPAVYGAIYDAESLIVSTDADDPLSVFRVLPELFDMGLRFLVPAAGGGVDGLDFLRVMSPTPTRAGGGCYWARRTLPLGLDIADRAHLGSFAARMRAALEAADRQPGSVWPMYTHLGAVGGRPPGPTPSPYIEEAAMEMLRDRAMGVRDRGLRMWFARASVLYDYCLILRSVGAHVSRDGDTIDIASWDDPVLGRRLPVSPAQLYGLTFYVDAPVKTTVRLDGRPIEIVSRNGPDETGRPSVTILESEIRAVIFDQLNPLANHPEEARIEGDCTWREDRLAVDGAVTLPMHGFELPSAQALTFAAEGRFGVRLRTQAGGSFYFGDPRWAEEDDHATYTLADQAAGTFVVPFHDLTWRDDTGGHAPSHALASISLIGAASFARVALLRPRATTLARDGFCVAGRAPHVQPGQTVDLSGRRERVDQRGWFCFSRVPRGVYRLATDGYCDRRGVLVEVSSDIANLDLSRAL